MKASPHTNGDLPHELAWIAGWAAKTGARWGEDWRDYVGDAWLRMHHEWETHKGACGKSFLMTAARYGVMDSRRNRYRPIVSGTPIDARIPIVPLSSGEFDPPFAGSSEVDCIARDLFAMLTPREEQIMALRYEGWRCGEASKEMGIARGTAEVLLHRARVKLRKLYGGNGR